MLVYLCRHAIAQPREESVGIDDSARELTAKGVTRMRRNVRALERLRVRLDEVWTSPFIRCKQTSDLLAESPVFQGRMRILDALRPGGDHIQVISELQANSILEGVALVGHEPDLGELATRLISGQTFSGVTFKKGGVACIAVERASTPLRGELRWLLTPAQMRALA